MWGRVRRQVGAGGLVRLAASVATSERVNGRVHQRHVCSLGSVPVTLSAWDCHDFWCGAKERLDALGGNRVTVAELGYVISDIARHIPRPTGGDVQAVTTAWIHEDPPVRTDALKPLTRKQRVLMRTRASDRIRDELAILDRWADAATAAMQAVDAGLRDCPQRIGRAR